MGCFEVPAASVANDLGRHNSIDLMPTSPSPESKSRIELVVPKSASAVQAARSEKPQLQQQRKQQLHLYSIAAPGMRHSSQNMQELSQLMAWADAVNMRPGWVQVQKGYFEAPGEHIVNHRCVGTLLFAPRRITCNGQSRDGICPWLKISHSL